MKIDITQPHTVKPLRGSGSDRAGQVEVAREVRSKFRDFVGQTFFGQMLKSMRATLDKPAYFHGGRAEEIFRGQLDQLLAEKMTAATADEIADPMFQRQFPEHYELLSNEEENERPTMDDLSGLRRY